MRLLLIGAIGDSKFVSNVGAEVEIKILDIKNSSVLFEVSLKPSARAMKDLEDFEESERIANNFKCLGVKSDINDLAFLKKQAD